MCADVFCTSHKSCSSNGAEIDPMQAAGRRKRSGSSSSQSSNQHDGGKSSSWSSRSESQDGNESTSSQDDADSSSSLENEASSESNDTQDPKVASVIQAASAMSIDDRRECARWMNLLRRRPNGDDEEEMEYWVNKVVAFSEAPELKARLRNIVDSHATSDVERRSLMGHAIAAAARARYDTAQSNDEGAAANDGSAGRATDTRRQHDGRMLSSASSSGQPSVSAPPREDDGIDTESAKSSLPADTPSSSSASPPSSTSTLY